MEKLIKSTYMFIRAMPSIILFELLYKIIITAIALPSLSILLKLAVEVSGTRYITSENIFDFLTHPLSLLLIIIILIICSILSLIEISAIIGGYGLLYSDMEIKVFWMLETGFRTVKKLFRNFNFILILYVLLILPLTQFTLTSGIFAFIGIPDIQTIYGISSRKIFILIGIVMIITAVILSSRIYSLHFFTLTDLKYLDCLKQSKKITANKKFNTAFSLIIWTLFITFSFLVIMFIVCFITAFAMKGFTEPENVFFISLKAIKKIINLFTAVSSLFFTPMLFSYITACFISENKESIKIEIP
ncbi:MAG: glycerophosphoryl diester phosphodiesterase membrane domain-containing protein, partial [Oscillospiraceae bacterium]|nr:glycerophosphoryl diester phosphodiesterase membrane domain-containing protein [Oscillospiraceae bacterium]